MYKRSTVGFAAKGMEMVKKKPSDSDQDDHDVDFESSLEELETIVRRLEQGGGALESALNDYANAIVLMRSCQVRLEKAERKIEILSGVDANGNPVVRPMKDQDLSLEDKQAGRDKRRGSSRETHAKGDERESLF